MDPLSRRVETARALGCEVVAIGTLERADGPPIPALLVDARDNDHAVALAQAIAVDDAAHDPEVRTWAAYARARLPEADDDALARLVHRIVRDHVAFTLEADETFRGAGTTFRLGQGDCDDHAIAVATLALALGLPARIVGLRNAERDITHACAQIHVGGAWRWAETTLDADFGEHPRDCAIRLGVLDRGDVLS